MVNHFFAQFKEAQKSAASVKKEIIRAEKVYKIKVKLLHNIWQGLESKKIDFRSARRLNKVYTNKKIRNVYNHILSDMYEKAQEIIDNQQDYNFRKLLYFLAENADEQIKIGSEFTTELRSGKIPEKSLFYELQDLLAKEARFMRVEEETFNKIEEMVLLLKAPGSSSGGYVHIIDAVKKGLVRSDGNTLWYDEKPIQGVKVKANMITIKGDHYSSLQNAQWIQGDEYVSPSLADPYSYFVEKGKFGNSSKRDIQKALGIKNAEAVVSLAIEVFPEQVYIKVQKGIPIKFAIAHLEPNQVVKVVSKVKKVA